MEGDAEANWKLKIIKADIWLSNHSSINLFKISTSKRGRSLKIYASCLLLINYSRASSPRLSSLDRSMASFSFRRTTVGVRATPGVWMGFFFFFSDLEMRERSSDYTLGAGGAVARGFAREAFGAVVGFEALGFFCFCGFGGAGASSESALSAERSTAAP